MASSIAEKIAEKFLKCGICLDNFRSPRALPCLHSFCEECLEGWAKKSMNKCMLTCPNCMKETPIPEEGIRGFPAHFLVKSLQETVEMEKKTVKGEETACGNCDVPGKLATVHCLDCHEFMCETCREQHKKIKAFKEHQVVTIETLGNGKISKINEMTQVRYCEKHDGEQKRFYCETCEKPVCRDCIVMRQCCRDHDYSTLKEASQSKVDQIHNLVKQCSESKKVYQTALTKTEEVERSLVTSVRKTKSQLASEKASFIQQINQIFKGYEDEVNSTQVKRTKELSQIKNELLVSLTKIETACKRGTDLTESGSDFKILSSYTSTIKSLQEVSNAQTIPTDAALSHIQIPALPYVVTGKKWKQIGQFNTESGTLTGITITSGNDIALLRYDHVELFSMSDKSKLSKFSTGYHGYGITSTQDDNYVIASHSHQKCYLYDTKGKELSSVTISAIDNPWTVAIDNHGNIIVGSESSTLSFHSIKTGTLISRFKVESNPRGLAVTRNGSIAVTYHTSPWFQLVDSSGNVIKSVRQPPEVKKWNPVALCCSKIDELFVTNTGEPKGVYMYTADGEYLGCVTTEVDESWGIALSQDDQKLFVAEYDNDVVKILQRS